ncbi:protein DETOXIFICATION 19-like isoform X2 [Silene latifolia]|uniref:protein DETOXIFICATION 19-like isoform X2 n=1 Tax=Silene latifolia TaxID=37657 RepID=UPI003D78985A
MSIENGTTPLLAATVEEGEGEDGWCKKVINKVVDVEEAKVQVLFSLPMILTIVFYYLIPLISVMFAGHLGQLQLAGSTLAHSWATVTGFAFMLGLSGGLETLCGQGYGAKQYNKMGIHLQASCIISLFVSIIISIIWWYTEPLLILLHQTPTISKQAASYLRCLIPGIFAYGILQNILRFLQTQSVVFPLVVCSVAPLLLHLCLNYVLVYCTSLGFLGAPLAASITFWVSALMLLIYVKFDKKFEHTWKGLTMESFRYVVPNLKLALPSAAMVCVNTEAIAYNFTYGLSAAASTRVSNELGAGRPDQAKNAMGVTLKLSILLGAIMVTVGFGHDTWAGLFSDSPEIIKAFAAMTPFLCITIFLDSIQGILSGVSRGCGWQQLTTYINLGTFYFIGMSIACLLAFKLHMYAKGLWIGLICGLAAQSGTLFLVTKLKNWASIELSSDKGNSILV